MAVERAQLAADAAGRVEVIALRPPADVLEPPEPEPPPVARRESRVLSWVMSYEGWAAIAGLAVLLAVVFILGLWLTH